MMSAFTPTGAGYARRGTSSGRKAATTARVITLSTFEQMGCERMPERGPPGGQLP